MAWCVVFFTALYYTADGGTEYADRFIEGLRAANITVNTTVSDTTTEVYTYMYIEEHLHKSL